MIEKRKLLELIPLTAEFIARTVTPDKSPNTSPIVSLDMSNTLELFLCVCDVLHALQLDSEGEVVGISIGEDSAEDDTFSH